MYAYHEMHDRKDPDLLHAYQDFFPKRVSVVYGVCDKNTFIHNYCEEYHKLLTIHKIICHKKLITLYTTNEAE